MKKGEELEVAVEKLAFGGKALARVEGFVVFLDHALPGQVVRARIVRRKRQFAEAKVLEVLRQSPHYVEPFCGHFGTCGGCKWQDMDYAEQIQWKREQVRECLVHLAREDLIPVDPIVPSDHERYYRNKMEYTFSDRRWLLPSEIAREDVTHDRSFALGLHVPGFYDRVFNVEECFLQSPRSVEILRAVRDWCRKSGLPPYSVKTHEGFWRFLVIREAKRTGQTLVNIITAPHREKNEAVERLADHLSDSFPWMSTLVHSVTGKKAQVAFGETSRILRGPGFIEERLGSLTFRISAHSFFQTNPHAAEKLYDTVLEMADLSGNECVWDLYCGTGSIALYVAHRAREVLGFEVVEEAVQDAFVNAEINRIHNCRFVSGDLKDVIRSAMSGLKGEGRPHVIITDPPRAGMHPTVLKAILEAAPRKVVTVSCNPSTLARDLSVLLEAYEIERVQPFDFFPHTPHMECAVKLVRKE